MSSNVEVRVPDIGGAAGVKVIEVLVAVGDTVLFQWGDKIKVGEEEYYIVRESEILAVIK